MLALFHDKRCCKCIKLFSCILWNFIVLGLVLSWWRIKHELKISAVSWLAREKFARRVTHEKGMWEAHAGSWRVMSGYQFRDCLVSRANPQGTRKTFCLEVLSVAFLPFTHIIYILITHKSMRGYSERKTLDKFSTTQHTHLLER